MTLRRDLGKCGRAAVRFVVAFLLLSTAASTHSQQVGSRSLSKQVDKKIEESFNTIKKDPKSWAQSVLEAQEALGKFGYGTLFTGKVDDRTKDALRAYQNRNSLRATGDLDYSTWVQIQRDSAALTPEIPIGPMYMFNDSDWDNILTAEGVWLEQGKEPTASTPLIATRIECFKPTRTCTAATHRSTLIHIQYFDIERWDQHEIETKPDDLPCGREQIHISRAEKSVLTINTAAYKDVEACTKLFGPAAEPAVSRLGDARSLMEARLKAYREASDRILVIPADKVHTGSAKQ